MKILGLDVGKNNFGYSLMENLTIIKSGILSKTITTFTNPILLKIQLDSFTAQIQKLTKHQNIIVAERFMQRGMLRGSPSEYCNFMLGITFSSINAIPLLITAAEWKRKFSEEIKNIKLHKDLQHKFDSSMMCFYAYLKLKLIDQKIFNKKLKEFLNATKYLSKK